MEPIRTMPNDTRRYGILAFEPGEVRLGVCDGIADFRLTRGFGREAGAGLDAGGGLDTGAGLDTALREG